ncbi:MAG TPA: hypothetical protein VMY05_11360 [Acidobacteriota bacterium]|nr:hypothetical protein [Acidobacteriota bacterium]
MDKQLDSVEHVPYQSSDRVKPLQESEREKQRKFAQALREKMEEELGKGRRKGQEDELLLEDDDRPASEDDGREGEDSSRAGADEPETDTPGSPDTDAHIDVKA